VNILLQLQDESFVYILYKVYQVLLFELICIVYDAYTHHHVNKLCEYAQLHIEDFFINTDELVYVHQDAAQVDKYSIFQFSTILSFINSISVFENTFHINTVLIQTTQSKYQLSCKYTLSHLMQGIVLKTFILQVTSQDCITQFNVLDHHEYTLLVL